MKEIDLYNQTQTYLSMELSSFSQSDTKKLWKIIQKHAQLYYESENPIISDVEYDELFKKLEFLEEKFFLDVKVSHTAWSEWKQSSFQKIAHSRPMISLDNTYNAEDLRDFDTRIKRILHPLRSSSTSPLPKGEEWKLPYTIEFKFDGLWVELVYNDGNLIKGITRWNGIQWEDVTENIMQISNIPKTINKPGIFEVRGEVVMPISSFERLNRQALEQWGKVFSNPRNAASGSLRVLDTSITKHRDLQYFAYDVSDFDEFSTWTYHSMIEHLQDLGFSISSYFPKCTSIQEVIHDIENLWDLKADIDFEIDGLVVKLDDMKLWWDVWFTEHHPRFAIAYKFPAEIVTTKLESVEHSVGRTGTITPVANLTPVNIGWAIIRRATLHNYDETQKLWVKIWDIVFLKRAGEVIPKIISVATHGEGEKIIPPNFCPSCWKQVFKDDEKVRFYCSNAYQCPAQMREKLAFAVGKQGFNIDGFWERQAELFYKLWFIEKFWDIFRLKNYREEMLLLDWFKEKSVNNLLDWIEVVRKTDIITFLKALGIPWVGKKTAKTIGKYLTELLITSWKDTFEEIFPNRETQSSLFWNEQTTINITDLELLPDVWPEVARSVVEFFIEQRDIAIDLLGELDVEISQSTNTNIGWKYDWKKMCITGSFEWYKRDDLAKILEEQWGEFVWSVSTKTDYLLAGDKAGSKLKKANELWVEVLSLEDFLAW